jgi:hypothetical protein
MAFNAHREAMQDTAVLMLAYITLHEKLKLGRADRHMALNWRSLGWVRRESSHPERWALTPEGHRVIRTWLPAAAELAMAGAREAAPVTRSAAATSSGLPMLPSCAPAQTERCGAPSLIEEGT